MTVKRRALAVLPLGVLAAVAAASPAGAATVKTDECVRYVKDQPTMTILGTEFAPNAAVTLATVSKAKPAITPFSSGSAQPTGAFLHQTLPPPFSSPNRTLESFTLIAADNTNPAAPVVATTPFQVVRFGLGTKPEPRRPTTKVTYTARGFTPGKRVYVHFRFAGITRRTVSLGVAKGPCGIASQRMRALPTKARYGTWTRYTDQSKTFSVKTAPAWKDSFRIFRRFF